MHRDTHKIQTEIAYRFCRFHRAVALNEGISKEFTQLIARMGGPERVVDTFRIDTSFCGMGDRPKWFEPEALKWSVEQMELTMKGDVLYLQRYLEGFWVLPAVFLSRDQFRIVSEIVLHDSQRGRMTQVDDLNVVGWRDVHELHRWHEFHNTVAEVGIADHWVHRYESRMFPAPRSMGGALEDVSVARRACIESFLRIVEPADGPYFEGSDDYDLVLSPDRIDTSEGKMVNLSDGQYEEFREISMSIATKKYLAAL